MAVTVKAKGHTLKFPDNVTDSQIQEAVSQLSPAVQGQIPPQLSPEQLATTLREQQGAVEQQLTGGIPTLQPGTERLIQGAIGAPTAIPPSPPTPDPTAFGGGAVPDQTLVPTPEPVDPTRSEIGQTVCGVAGRFTGATMGARFGAPGAIIGRALGAAAGGSVAPCMRRSVPGCRVGIPPVNCCSTAPCCSLRVVANCSGDN